MRIRSEHIALCVALLASARVVGAQAEDKNEQYRAELRAAAADYHAGNFAEAIIRYQKVYAAVGSHDGYRIAFNLGRAYEAHGEPRLSAESYQSYLDEIERRRAAGETVEQRVLDQEIEAKQRIAELTTRLGRIHVLAGVDRTIIARIDQGAPRIAEFVVFVDPGKHTVTFGTDPKAPHVEVEVKPGGSLDVEPPPPEPPPAPLPPPITYEKRIEHPFSQWVPIIAGGVAVVSVVVPIVTYANALSTKSDYDGAVSSGDRARSVQLGSDYDNAKGTAYASIAVPAIFAAGAVALTVWWYLGKREVLVPIGRF
jgi:tetratricopeptide (TPR) repeat protein